MSSGPELRRRSTVSSSSRVEHGHRSSASGHHRRHRSRREELDEEYAASAAPVYRARRDSLSASPQQSRVRVIREEPRPRRSNGDGTWMLRTFGVAPMNREARYREEPKPRRVASVRRRRDSIERGERVERTRSVRRMSSEGVRVNRSGVTRSVSMRENASRPPQRPTVVRSQSTSQRIRPARPAEPALATVAEGTAPTTATPLPRKERPPSLLGAIFNIGPPKPEPKIECLTCLSDDIPISRSAKLACSHRMCHACLRRIFTLSVTDPQHMPPRCCTSDHIPLKHVDKLFDTKFKLKWNKKFQEYTTNNRIYCPTKGCGDWIKPKDIQDLSGGRKMGRCQRCRTKVCVACNGKWHSSADCPKDDATAQFAEIAKKAGWQRCYNCSAMVELKEGCNHMTCRCRAEFCMICGSKWKSCECPWFNYAAVENDRLRHINVAEVRRGAGRGMDMPRQYQEELDRRREQERLDEEMARRMQGLWGPPPGMGNEIFVRRATNILTGNIRTQGNAAHELLAEVNAPRPGQRAPRPTTREVRTPSLSPSPSPPPAFAAFNAAPRPPTPPIPRRYNSTSSGSRGTGTWGSWAAEPREPSARELAGLEAVGNAGRVRQWRSHVEDDGSVPVL